MAEVPQKLPITGKLLDAVTTRASSQPDVTLAIDEYRVLSTGARSFDSLSRPAGHIARSSPTLNQISRRVEFQHRRRGDTAIRARRFRGRAILIMLGLTIGGALALFAWRAPKLESGAEFEPVSRESALLLNNLLLSFAVSVVFFGTLYPLALQAVTGERISVGAPYFAMLFAPAFVVLLLFLPFGPRLAWHKGDLRETLRILAPAAGVALVAGLAVLAIATPRSLAAAGSFALAFWVIAASSIDLRRKADAHSLTAQGWASALAHAGLGISLLGIASTTVWRSEALDVLGPGQSLTVAGYHLRFDGVVPTEGPNYHAMRAMIEVREGDHFVGVISPEKRIYPAEGQDISNTSIRTTGFSDLYVALGDDRGGGRWSIRAFVNPLAPFIWLGGAIMALGGLATLWGRVRVRFARLAPAE